MRLCMYGRAALAAIFASAMAIAASAHSSRRALLIGINDYSASHLKRPASAAPGVDRYWPHLAGAVNDVARMRDMLVRLYGFAPADVMLLCDQQATRAAILDAIEKQLINASKPGDELLFYYAGHGSFAPNPASTEPDRRDETIVPADSRLGAPDITDKVLRRLFNRVLDQGARLTVILDSCHSASGVRTAGAIRGIKPGSYAILDKGEDRPPPEDRGAVVIAATQDYGTAREAVDDEGKACGAFSWAWARALRDAAPGEPVFDTFLRAQARMRLEAPSQDPVFACGGEARHTPFLRSSRRDHRLGKTVVGVANVQDDGITVTLQGGWASGLAPGTLLRPAGGGALRVRVTTMIGVAQALGRIERPGGKLASGALLEVVAWSAPPGRPLRVWMPRVAGPIERPEKWATELAREATRRRVRWIDDPTDASPTHLLRWREREWELLTVDRPPRRIVAGDAPSVLAAVPAGAALFVQMPAPAALTDRVAIGPGSEYPGIVAASQPEEADYFLAGRYAHGSLEYAWVRPAVTYANHRGSPLPSRSRWHSSASIPEAATLLTDDAVGLRRIHGWLLLASPTDEASPYHLVIRHAPDGAPVKDGNLFGNQHYGMVMRITSAHVPAEIAPRYVYVFAIDTNGQSTLLYPRHGTENHFPLSAAHPPREIVLPATFRIDAPYGVETYFLLTTDEPLANPELLESAGVRDLKGRGNTALDELFWLMFAGRRSAVPISVPRWSVERIVMQSNAAGAK